MMSAFAALSHKASGTSLSAGCGVAIDRSGPDVLGHRVPPGQR